MNTKTVIAGLKSAADPARRATSKTMFPTSMEYLGVRNPDMKKLVKTFGGKVQPLFQRLE